MSYLHEAVQYIQNNTVIPQKNKSVSCPTDDLLNFEEDLVSKQYMETDDPQGNAYEIIPGSSSEKSDFNIGASEAEAQEVELPHERFPNQTSRNEESLKRFPNQTSRNEPRFPNQTLRNEQTSSEDAQYSSYLIKTTIKHLMDKRVRLPLDSTHLNLNDVLTAMESKYKPYELLEKVSILLF